MTSSAGRSSALVRRAAPLLALVLALTVMGPLPASAAGRAMAPGGAPAVGPAASNAGCLGPDALCDLGGLPHILPDPGSLVGGGIAGMVDIPNPLGELGDVVSKAAADAWTSAMLAIWDSGLFVLRVVLTFSELFLTPDLSGDGPGQGVYGFTLWLALTLVVTLAMIQLGVAVFKRESKGLARAIIGAAQFVVVCCCWFGYCVSIVAACEALTRGLMGSLLKVRTWPEWDPLGGLATQDISDSAVATVLAFLGLFLWIAAIGHILVLLARAASLLVLTASGPLAAAGLVSEFARAWFWKSLRWFHAAAFTPVLMVMVLGIGIQLTGGVAAHLADGAQRAIGTALPAVMLILVSVVAPLALFKLLAFVDPGTPSGASFRQGMALQGGLQALMSGSGSAAEGATTASSADAHGRSSGEQNAEASTQGRFSGATQGMLGSLGTVGQAMSTGLGWINSAGAKVTSLMADETNQAGVGQSTYGPDFSGYRAVGNGSASQVSDEGPAEDLPVSPPHPPEHPAPSTLPVGGSGGPSSPSSGATPPPAAGAGGAGGAAGAAGSIPPVAV